MTIRPILLGLGIVSVAPAQAETSIRISLKDRYLTLLDDGKEIGKYPVAILSGHLNHRHGREAMPSRRWILSRFITRKSR